MAWTVPCLWPGETFFILGGGPSLKGFDAAKLRGRGRVIAVNEAGLAGRPGAADEKPHAPWADVLYWADQRWFNWNHRRLGEHRGFLKVCRLAPPLATGFDIKVLPFSREALVEDGRALAGFDSGGAAINLAYLLGARAGGRIVLLGFDMGGANWHRRHQGSSDESRYVTHFMPPIAAMAWPLKSRGVEVLNCTPGSALTCFPHARLEDVLMDDDDKTPGTDPGAAGATDEAAVTDHGGLELCPVRELDRVVGALAVFERMRVTLRLRGADLVTRRSAGWWQRRLSLAFPSVVVEAQDAERVVFLCGKIAPAAPRLAGAAGAGPA